MKKIISHIKHFLEAPNTHTVYNFFFREKKKRRILEENRRKSPRFGIKERIVVSLTSYPARFSTLQDTLKSVLNQTKKPDDIIVWLDVGEEEMTDEMRRLQKYGITYRFNVENLKPHNKYFYAMQEFPSSLVITVDDDVIYPRNLVKSLYKTWKKHPDCVCARRVHKITFTSDGKIAPYEDWIWDCTELAEPSHALCATGVGGVLYPPGSLDKRAFSAETIKAECLAADDIWLKTMELLNDTKVVWTKNYLTLPPISEGSQSLALNHTNVKGGGNDMYIQNMLRLYGGELRHFLEQDNHHG